MAVGPLARLLSALAAECDDLAIRVEDMQRLLPGAGQTPDARPPAAQPLGADAMRAAQDIDYVHQHLDNLAQFLTRFSEMTPADILVDLETPLASLRLANLQHRLAGTEPDTNTTKAGELELL